MKGEDARPAVLMLCATGDPDAIPHSVDISAESLCEAAVRGLAAKRKSELIAPPPKLGTQLVITVKQPAIPEIGGVIGRLQPY